MYNVLRGVERLVDRFIDIIFMMILVIGLYYVYDSITVFNNSSVDNVIAYKPSRGETEILKELSDDCIGWITIYDSNVDYPLMQGKDNYEYLNKDAYGAYSLSGSIFLDSRNDKRFNDEYSLVYGHHMANNYMFGALDAFKDKAFFAKHRNGEIIIDGDYFEIDVFAYSVTDASEGIVFNPDTEADRLAWIRKNNEIFYEPRGSRIIALSTCKSPLSTIRTIVFVSIVE